MKVFFSLQKYVIQGSTLSIHTHDPLRDETERYGRGAAPQKVVYSGGSAEGPGSAVAWGSVEAARRQVSVGQLEGGGAGAQALSPVCGSHARYVEKQVRPGHGAVSTGLCARAGLDTVCFVGLGGSAALSNCTLRATTG